MLNDMKNFKKNSKGITIIALIITVIVLLILVSATLAFLYGDDGIIRKVEEASSEYDRAAVKETVQIETIMSYDDTAKFDKNKFKKKIEKNLGVNLNDIEEDEDGNIRFPYKNHNIVVDEEGNVWVDEEPPSKTPITPSPDKDPEPEKPRILLGTPENEKKYGWKVVGYNQAGYEWRLFYQNEDYVYIIMDGFVIDETLNDKISKYPNYGDDISEIGKELNPMVGSLFSKDNEWTNAQGVAYLLDHEGVWDKKYKSKDAEFAIGSPTGELFAKSWEKTHSQQSLGLALSTYGYSYNRVNNVLTTDHGGIYYDYSTTWWIASPFDEKTDILLVIGAKHGRFGTSSAINSSSGVLYTDINAIRPVICFKKENFKYDLVMDQANSEVWGDEVNYEVTMENGEKVNDWRIFYGDRDYMYIIKTDYLSWDFVPSAAKNTGMVQGAELEDSGLAGVSWSDPTTRLSEISDETLEKFHFKLYKSNKGTEQENTNVTAHLLEPTNWEIFASGANNAQAIGGPTLELFVESWNARYSNNKLYTALNGTEGYYVGTDLNPTTTSADLSKTGGYSNTLYFSHQTGENIIGLKDRKELGSVKSYWIASPSAKKFNTQMRIRYSGDVGSAGLVPDTAGTIGLRPVVAIPLDSNEVTKDQKTGIWHIN